MHTFDLPAVDECISFAAFFMALSIHVQSEVIELEEGAAFHSK